MTTIGIDLGTTNSLVAQRRSEEAYKNDNSERIYSGNKLEVRLKK